jgi:hypothetical protein
VVLSDIDPQRRGILKCDFLKNDPPPGTRGSILITNPPFNIVDEFCERALRLLDAGHLRAVVLLYRADKANTQDRIEVFNRAAYEVTVTARTRWLPGPGESPRGGSRGSCGWAARKGRRSTGASTVTTSTRSLREPAKSVGSPLAGSVTGWVSPTPSIIVRPAQRASFRGRPTRSPRRRAAGSIAAR